MLFYEWRMALLFTLEIKKTAMKNILQILFLSLLFPALSFATTDEPFKEITFKSIDGVNLTADLYKINNTAPYIILCHQAGYSRGEYREIAPKLNRLGFNCLAIDQRSGQEVNGVINQTFKAAQLSGKGTEYTDAEQDVNAAIAYVNGELKANKIILWGSSYSAALTFVVASKNKRVDGILAFSPGEYFKVNGKSISDFAERVSCPVFVSSAKNEESAWMGIYEKVSSPKRYFLPTDDGFHGSKALWTDKKGHEKVWAAVEKYLMTFE